MSGSFAGLDLIGVEDAEAEDAGKWLIHGPQGSGKTTLASTIAQVGPTLFVDLVGEKGTKSFRGAPYAANIKTVRPSSVTQLYDLFWKLDSGDHPYKAVIIDSLTALQRMALRFAMNVTETAVREIRQGTAPADQRTWGEALNIMSDTAVFWYGLADGHRKNPMHVIMTSQTRVLENELTGAESRQPDVQPGALRITLAAPDYVLYTDLEPDLEADTEDGDVYKHIVRFGANPDFRTKARIPVHLRGKLPTVLGRRTAPDLAQLSRILGLGGAQAPAPATPAKGTTKNTKNTKQNGA